MYIKVYVKLRPSLMSHLLIGTILVAFSIPPTCSYIRLLNLYFLLRFNKLDIVSLSILNKIIILRIYIYLNSVNLDYEFFL